MSGRDEDIKILFVYKYSLSLCIILYWVVKRVWKCYIEFPLYKYISLLLLLLEDFLFRNLKISHWVTFFTTTIWNKLRWKSQCLSIFREYFRNHKKMLKWPISTLCLMQWCPFIDWLKFETCLSSQRNFEMANLGYILVQMWLGNANKNVASIRRICDRSDRPKKEIE